MTLQRPSCPRSRITIDGNAYFCLEQAARYAYPEEGCGVLLGDRDARIVRESRSLDNRAGESASGRHYRIDPTELLRLERRAEEEGYQILGFWHSHADEEAVLSGEDERNMVPGLIYLILPVIGGRPGRGRAYEKTAADEAASEISISLKENR